MAITGKVKTLFEDKEKTSAIFPRTKASAITDSNNKNLEVIINEVTTDVAQALDLFINGADDDYINEKLEEILGV